mmetsp:Transcript_43761/g.171228  ORF Transcript_43761/g.171228 Transcript_43761/m.171228 type:complete len:84 (+) Transcript_43761:170-421(+)
MLSVQLKEGKQGKKRKEAAVKEKLNQAIAAGEKLTNELWREVNEVGRKVCFEKFRCFFCCLIVRLGLRFVRSFVVSFCKFFLP